MKILLDLTERHSIYTYCISRRHVFGGKQFKPRHDLLTTSVHLSWPYWIGFGLTSNEAA
jgi:hypothetical protein